MSSPTRQSGFTLTEMLITVTIVIILAAIAVPNYRGQVLRSNRSDAMSALMRIAAEQEKFYVQNNTYTDDLGDDGLKTGNSSVNNHYRLRVRNASLTAFDAEATPLNRQVDDKKCALFSIDQQGQKKAFSDTDEETTNLCWR